MYTLHVQSHPEDRGDFGQGLTNDISEYTFRMELSIYGMCCSYIVLANPNMKLRIQFIIMKIFMKIVKICPKSPRFTVSKLQCQSPKRVGKSYLWHCAQWDIAKGGRIHPITQNYSQYCLLPGIN